jgi:hypothetical protein
VVWTDPRRGGNCKVHRGPPFTRTLNANEPRAMAKDLIILALFGAAAWYGYTHYEVRIKQILGLSPPRTVRILPEQFTCDGRIYCSQMTSCEEARFFLLHCPSTKMDGNGDGIPCEKQWCK